MNLNLIVILRADPSYRVPSNQSDQLVKHDLHEKSVERGIMLPVPYTFIFYLVYVYYITPVHSNRPCKK